MNIKVERHFFDSYLNPCSIYHCIIELHLCRYLKYRIYSQRKYSLPNYLTVDQGPPEVKINIKA